MNRGTVNRIPIADQVAWGLFPGECFNDLLRDPFCRRVRCHVDPDKLSPNQPDNNQNVEQVKGLGRSSSRLAARSQTMLVRLRRERYSPSKLLRWSKRARETLIA
jgi:hypothetical protein